jgi:hypothetical protein
VPISDTERRDYARRRLALWADGLSLTGSPALQVDGFSRTPADDTRPLWRLTFEDLPGRASGHVSSTQTAVEESVQLVSDLFWPIETSDRWELDAAASDLIYALRELRLTFREYSTPASPSDVSGYYLRIVDPPSVSRLPSEDQYHRRRVLAVVRWFSAHS